MAFVAKPSIPGLEKETERAITSQFRALQHNLDDLNLPTDAVTELKAGSFQAQTGQLCRCTPPAAGILLLLPPATDLNDSETVRVAIESVASGGTVKVTVVGHQTIDGASSKTLTTVGMTQFTSLGPTGWSSMGGGGGGAAAVPTGTGFRHITAGVEDAAAKLVDTADVNNSQITNAKLANMAANTVKVEATGSAAAPQDLAMAASTMLARLAAGNIVAASTAQVLTLLAAFSSVTIQAFTASGTYTPTSGMKSCIVFTTGSGGGGGGADNNAATAFFIGVGGGGGAGGTCIEFFSAATIGASQTVTIGAVGAAGSATNGTDGGAGGNSTFGALHTANGGAGGTGSGLSATLGQVAAGGAGGAPSGGTLNITGGDGTDGWGIAVDSTNDSRTTLPGEGGGTMWGGPTKATATQNRTAGGNAAFTQAGKNGVVFGSGGSGAACSFSIAGAAGGTGALGCCLVIEFV